MNLVEKITSRIRSWSSRNLAYQGRLVLVNYVLLSIQVYWSHVFIIPKKVLNEVESICRAFLWSGEYFSRKPGYVAWDKVCLPKYAGCLGIRKIGTWNIAAMGRYVWTVVTKKDNLWIKWVNEVYVQQHN